ncbi:hypothetical protein PCL_12084 [Purpureocillium lilacinum]|uniref:Uncharacterized protein n=1 Tax=Purpureocillium lilacinum TaxID=33203 RepID=A0A2U3DPJ1_PURLI|nr:hypothetical protein PCL_12084 [Purpureocillium lilacinum]
MLVSAGSVGSGNRSWESSTYWTPEAPTGVGKQPLVYNPVYPRQSFGTTTFAATALFGRQHPNESSLRRTVMRPRSSRAGSRQVSHSAHISQGSDDRKGIAPFATPLYPDRTSHQPSRYTGLSPPSAPQSIKPAVLC